MKHITATIVALVAIAGIFGTTFTIQTASALTDTEILLQIWDMVNGTSIDVSSLIYKIDHLQNSTAIMARLAEIKDSLDKVTLRLGYGNTSSTFTLKSDFDKVLASLYTANGTNRIEVINGNQLVLADISENTFNKLQDTQTTVNETKSSVDSNTLKIGSFEFNIQLLLIIGLVIIAMIVFFLVLFVRQGKGSVREYRGQNESLFMPPPPPSPKAAYSQQEYQEAAEAVDSMPDCFRIQFDPKAVECKTCGVWKECSGEPVKRQHTAKITQRPPEKQHIVKPPQRSRYVKQ